ncbi:hypothetical protein ACWCQL_38160 [Streptomyces sp. NPDC002073]
MSSNRWSRDSNGKNHGEQVPGERGISAGADVGLGITGDQNQVTNAGDVIRGDKHEITTTEHHYHVTAGTGSAWFAPVGAPSLDRHQQAELILIGPLNTEQFAPVLRQADTLMSTDPEQSARLYANIAVDLYAAGFRGHAQVMQGKQLAALQAAGLLLRAVELAGDLAIASLQVGDRDQARLLAGKIEELARKCTEANEPQADRAQRIARLLRAALQSLLHPLGDVNPLRETLLTGPAEDDPGYRPVLVLLLAEQVLAVAPDSIDELADLVSDAIRTLDGGGDDWDQTKLRLRLVRAHYDSAERRELHQAARRHRIPARPASVVFAREARRLVEEGRADEALEAYRDAVNDGIRADLPQDAADWLYSIRSINAWFGPWRTDIDDEHRLAQALRATGTGSVLVRTRSPREQAMSALVRQSPREAIAAAQRWLVDSVVTGDWTGELEALRFLAGLYQNNAEPGLAAVYYQRAGEAKAAKKLAASSGDTLLPLGPLQGVPWWVARVRAAQLEAQADLLDDDAIAAHLGDLIDLARRLLSEDLADSPHHNLVHQVISSACALAPRGTVEQASQVLADLVDLERMERDATCLAIANAHPGLAFQAVTKLFDHAERGAHDALEALTDPRLVKILTSPFVLTRPEQEVFQSKLADLADADTYTAALALCQVAPAHPTVQAKAQAARDRILSRPAPDPHTTAIGTQLANDAFLVSELDEPSRQRCADKLMEIASDKRETADSRRTALIGLRNLITELPPAYKTATFDRAKAFVLGEQDGSHLDHEMTGAPHPLSWARFSFGPSSLRGPAVKLAHAAAQHDDEHLWVREQAVILLRAEVSSEVQAAARVLAHLPPQVARTVDPALLAAHSSRPVRQAGAVLAVRHAEEHGRTIRRLAEDTDHTVRRTLAEAAAHHAKEGPLHPVVREVLERLAQDARASVRHAAVAASSS